MNLYNLLLKKLKPLNIQNGDIGVFCFTCYHNGVLGYYPVVDIYSNESSYIYAKIEVLGVYDNLVEVNLISIKIHDSTDKEIQKEIKNNFPQYLNIKAIKWIIKNESINKNINI